MQRCRLALAFFCTSLALLLTGCSDAFNAGPLQYVEDDALNKTVEGRPDLGAKPILKTKIRKALSRLFGDSPQRIRIPAGSGLREGGLLLAAYMQKGEGDQTKYYRLYEDRTISVPTEVSPSESADFEPQAGGYALYRRNCVHCHGVSGAGDGPTAPFLYPTPRDYRKGIFKFTSTPSGARPHRDDLRRTISHGLHGTSMPAFHSLMTASEIEQVIDYVMFLSMRGETELALIDAAGVAEDKDPDALSDQIVDEEANNVFNKWKVAQTQVFSPPSSRTASTHPSIERGRDLFLGAPPRSWNAPAATGRWPRATDPALSARNSSMKSSSGEIPASGRIGSRGNWPNCPRTKPTSWQTSGKRNPTTGGTRCGRQT